MERNKRVATSLIELYDKDEDPNQVIEILRKENDNVLHEVCRVATYGLAYLKHKKTLLDDFYIDDPTEDKPLTLEAIEKILKLKGMSS